MTFSLVSGASLEEPSSGGREPEPDKAARRETQVDPLEEHFGRECEFCKKTLGRTFTCKALCFCLTFLLRNY